MTREEIIRLFMRMLSNVRDGTDMRRAIAWKLMALRE